MKIELCVDNEFRLGAFCKFGYLPPIFAFNGDRFFDDCCRGHRVRMLGSSVDSGCVHLLPRSTGAVTMCSRSGFSFESISSRSV